MGGKTIGHERAPVVTGRDISIGLGRIGDRRWSRLDAAGILKKREWGGNGEVGGGCGVGKGRRGN